MAQRRDSPDKYIPFQKNDYLCNPKLPDNREIERRLSFIQSGSCRSGTVFSRQSKYNRRGGVSPIVQGAGKRPVHDFFQLIIKNKDCYDHHADQRGRKY